MPLPQAMGLAGYFLGSSSKWAQPPGRVEGGGGKGSPRWLCTWIGSRADPETCLPPRICFLQGPG